MSRVWSCNEWDPLEEVIVGNPLNARFPTPDRSTQVAEFPDRPLAEIPRGPFPQRIIEETEEDLNEFAESWKARASPSNVRRHGRTRPRSPRSIGSPRDTTTTAPATSCWSSATRSSRRPTSSAAARRRPSAIAALLMDYMKSGAKWYSAPKPMLLDSLFEGVDLDKPTPRNDEPAFDAANVLRFGRDLIYLVSATGNELGGQWLQSILGEQFRVHFLKDVYFGSHIDSTLVALRPGLVLCNPSRLNDDTLPEILKQWKVIYSPPMENTDRYDADYLSKCIGSDWIDMNAFSISPDLVVVDRNQPPDQLLEKEGLDVIPLKLRHSKLLGGGPHCVTLDVRRKGTLERYFD